MPQAVHIDTVADGRWPDATPDKMKVATGLRVGGLPNGTSGGKAAVAMLLEFEDGTFAYVDVTLRMLGTVVRALEAGLDQPWDG